MPLVPLPLANEAMRRLVPPCRRVIYANELNYRFIAEWRRIFIGFFIVFVCFYACITIEHSFDNNNNDN